MAKFISIMGLFFLLGFNKVVGQMSMPYQFSSLGLLDGMETASSGPIVFQSQSDCLDLVTGIPVFIADRKGGTFVMNCMAIEDGKKLALVLYPNPVIEKTLLRASLRPVLSRNFIVRIFNLSGAIVLQKKVTALEIFAGVLLDVSNLSKGNYIISTESENYREQISFIKAN